MNNDIFIIIPSRIGSTRLKNKPLADLNGKTLIQRVFNKAKEVTNNVIIATDSKEIIDHCKQFNAECILTDKNHISGTDRIFEAATKLNLKNEQFIINLQGDEPFMKKELIDQIIHDFYQYKCDVITASHKLDQVDFINPNSVKVYAKKGYADNFCRLPAKSRDYQKHIGIYGYCFKTLKQIVSLEPTANEKEHKLEQLRFMDNGMSIYVSEYNENIVPGIDTQDDLNNAIEYIKNNED